jgi:hypothetical protein
MLVICAVALYGGSLGAGFVFDDAHTILRHPGVTGPFSPRAIFLRDWWGEPLGAAESLGSWRPIATLSLWIDCHLGKGSALAFHLGNLAIFAALLVAIDRFLDAWLGDALRVGARRLVLAAFAALAIHVEVVANATGRAEMLALLFAVLALRAAIGPPTALRLTGMAIAFAASMLSKESAYPLALFAPILALRRSIGPEEEGPSAEDRRRARAVAVVAGVVLIGAIVLRARLVGRFHRDDLQMKFDNPLVYAPLGRRVLGGLEVITHHLQHATSGVDLCPDYSYAGVALSDGVSLRAIVGLAALGGALWLAVRVRRTQPRLAEAIVGFFASYVAVSQLILPATVLVADRVFFTPSLFLLVGVGLALERVAHARPRVSRLIALAAAAFVAQQALMTALSVPAWKSDATLARAGVRTCPNVIRLRITRIEVARAENDVEEGVWNALAAAAVLSQFPRALDDDFLPAEEQPFPDRLAALKRSLGTNFTAVRAQAATIARSLRHQEAARALSAP